MPLVQSVLKQELQKFIDSEYSGYTGFPADVSEVADKWSTAINNYAGSVIPISTTASAAKSAMQSGLSGITVTPPTFEALFISGISAYATALAAGMLPLFVGTPPVTPIAISTIFPLGLAGATGEEISDAFATIIHTWFLTGTATPSVGGSPIIWS